MIVVLANQWDQVARAFAARWPEHNIRVLTPQDLSRSGWRQRLGDGRGSTVVVDGEQVPQSEITGVLTRLPCVHEEDLGEIAASDRAYVAAEMMAFLWHWLSSLRCPVINRPSSTCLTGPGWRREAWVRAAASVGITVLPVRRHVSRSEADIAEEVRDTFTVSVLGDSVVGCDDNNLRQSVRRLSRLADVDYLSARFSSAEPHARLLDVDVFPDLSDDRISALLLDYLQPRAVACP